ncbi:MAG: LysR family transcriptional regulator [Betaproteobacteria bacterium]|nr:LysR family transcriptional regulator [Betaproteobacteria bacterium]
MTAPLKLSQLRHLVAVVEAGTVRQAAKSLFLSQSSVTKSIQQLEEAVGVDLLHRTTHGVTPTAAGRAIIARAKAIEAELREARNDIDNILGSGTGEVRSPPRRPSRCRCCRGRCSVQADAAPGVAPAAGGRLSLTS